MIFQLGTSKIANVKQEFYSDWTYKGYFSETKYFNVRLVWNIYHLTEPNSTRKRSLENEKVPMQLLWQKLYN